MTKCEICKEYNTSAQLIDEQKLVCKECLEKGGKYVGKHV